MIKVERIWRRDDVRSFCMRHNLYTRGDNRAYEAMLTMVEVTEPAPENVYEVAKDILEHSADEEQTVTNLMFLIDRECILTFYEVKE